MKIGNLVSTGASASQKAGIDLQLEGKKWEQLIRKADEESSKISNQKR